LVTAAKSLRGAEALSKELHGAHRRIETKLGDAWPGRALSVGGCYVRKAGQVTLVEQS
jgi:hypothetical protein